MKRVSRSIVLRDGPSCGELQQTLETILRSFKETLDLFFLHEKKIERAAGVVVHIWWEPQNPALDVRLVCDDVLGAKYVNVTAPDGEQLRRVLDALSFRLEVVPVAELQDRAHRDNSDAAWVQLALGVREDFDEETFRAIKDALESPIAARRRAAAQAAAVLGWPQLRQALRDALAREEDVAVRAVLDAVFPSIAEDPGSNMDG